MTRKLTEDLYSAACRDIYAGRIKPALEMVEKLIRISGSDDYFYQFETDTDNYRTLLRYAVEGYEDPQREAIINALSASLLGLADEVKYKLQETEFQFTRLQRLSLQTVFGRDPERHASRIEAMLFERTVDRLLGETVAGGSFQEEKDLSPGHQADQIFRMIWLTRKMSAPITSVLQRIIHSGQIEWHEKSLFISGLTLSSLSCFDSQKLSLLIETAEAHQNQVYQRALTGLVLNLLVYDQRIRFYPHLMEQLGKLFTDETLRQETELILLQFLQARETDKITHDFENEVLPEMKKMMPRIEDKLQLNDQSTDEEMDGKNPGWKDMIEEVPGLIEKIEKFSRMQMEGGDVFMSTFKLLKRFDFFNQMSNWFVPFHVNHQYILEAFPSNDPINQRLLESLERAFYICNSDKYSFALNFRAIPDQQRTMIVTNFEAEFAQMQEMASEEQLLDQSIAGNSVYIQYIQDLYRFFKLFPTRGEFDDIFLRKLSLGNFIIYKTFIARRAFSEKVATFLFDREHYEEAVNEYTDLINTFGPSGEYFERIGYSRQKSGDYAGAIDAYRKAELFDGNRLWILKKIGYCYLKELKYQDAMTYFAEASKIDPEDLSLQLQIGQCHLNLKEYQQALHQYLNARFFAPENLKVLRPIAYCQFILGQCSQSDETYEKIFQLLRAPSAYDYMNAANVRLCLGKRKDAIDLYHQSFAQKNISRTELLEAFDEDSRHLAANGISQAEIPLIRDFLLFLTEQ